jgi:hypothetical protein
VLLAPGTHYGMEFNVWELSLTLIAKLDKYL